MENGPLGPLLIKVKMFDRYNYSEEYGQYCPISGLLLHQLSNEGNLPSCSGPLVWIKDERE